MYRASWRSGHPKTTRKFLSFSPNNLLQFWYPPLRFGSQPWIPKPLFFLVFLLYTADLGFLFRGNTKAPVIEIKVSAPAPCKKKTTINIQAEVDGILYMGILRISMINLSCVTLVLYFFCIFGVPRRLAETCRKLPVGGLPIESCHRQSDFVLLKNTRQEVL